MPRSNRIWIIDDDRSIRWVLEKALQKAGMEVSLFPSADGIMDALSRGQPDAIVSDVRMPGMDGLALLDHITRRYPELPVIIMTAHSDLDSAVAAFHGGAFEYLAKGPGKGVQNLGDRQSGNHWQGSSHAGGISRHRSIGAIQYHGSDKR